jgi:hypothetical protein
MEILIETKDGHFFKADIKPMRAFPSYIKMIYQDKMRYFKRKSENSLDSEYHEIDMIDATKKE